LSAGPEMSGVAALELRNLQVAYRTRGHDQMVLRGVSLRIERGQSYGLVGESGCGKSTVALAALRALPRSGVVTGGHTIINGQDVAALDREGLRRLRARAVSMVYQDASRALNPSLTIGRQLNEAFEAIGQRGGAAAEAMLEQVQIAAPRRVMEAYPHQLSGGMQQRVVIAMALVKDPALLVLDEPTTGLDATVEAEVLDLIATLRRATGTAVLFISHNLGVIERMCDRVGVLYAGTLVEEGDAARLLARPAHPYTGRLLGCLPVAGRRKSDGRLESIPGFLPPPGALPPGCVFAPRCDRADDLCRRVDPPAWRPALRNGDHMALCHYPITTAALAPLAMANPAPLVATQGLPVLRAERVSKSFGLLRAVTDVSLTLHAGQTLGLVGESGSGKTTLAKLLLGLVAPDAGSFIELDSRPVAGAARARSRADRKALQVVFQNPDSALNRSHTVRHLVARSLSKLAGLRGQALEQRLSALIAAVRLTGAHLGMRPRQLSGGLKQRVAIARAFAGDPRVVICDEPTSALDVSVQASILNLLVDLQQNAGVSYVFISHDLGVVRYLSDRIAVLYLGRTMEIGPAEAVFDGPHHPYTEALLSAVPGTPGPRVRLQGDIPSPLAHLPGCAFSSRCPRKIGPICDEEPPPLVEQDDHAIRCHIPRHALGRRTTPAKAIWSTV